MTGVQTCALPIWLGQGLGLRLGQGCYVCTSCPEQPLPPCGQRPGRLVQQAGLPAPDPSTKPAPCASWERTPPPRASCHQQPARRTTATQTSNRGEVPWPSALAENCTVTCDQLPGPEDERRRPGRGCGRRRLTWRGRGRGGGGVEEAEAGGQLCSKIGRASCRERVSSPV